MPAISSIESESPESAVPFAGLSAAVGFGGFPDSEIETVPVEDSLVRQLTVLGVGRNSDLFVECGDSSRVLDANNGTVRATYSDLGGADETWFNPGDGSAYVELNAKGGVGGLDTVHKKTFFIPVAGTQGAHSIAAAPHGNRVFMPISDDPDNGAGGIVMLRRAGARGDNE